MQMSWRVAAQITTELVRVYVSKMNRITNEFVSYDIDPRSITAMIANRDHEKFCKVRTRGDQVARISSNLFIGSTSSISFRALLYFSKTKEQTEKIHDEERQHTQVCIRTFNRQLSMDWHFWYEHPVYVSSWSMTEMQEMLNDGRVYLVYGSMSRWCKTGKRRQRWARSCARRHEMDDGQFEIDKTADGRAFGRVSSRTDAIVMYSPRLVQRSVEGIQEAADWRQTTDRCKSVFNREMTDLLGLDTEERWEDEYDQWGILLVPTKVKKGKKEEVDRKLK